MFDEFNLHAVNFIFEVPPRHPENWGSRMVASKGRESHLDFSSAEQLCTPAATPPNSFFPSKKAVEKFEGERGKGTAGDLLGWLDWYN